MRAGLGLLLVAALPLGCASTSPGLQDFISKAADALQARDVPRAQILAEKATRLADDLLLAQKNPRSAR